MLIEALDVVNVDVEGVGAPLRRGRLTETEAQRRPEQVVEGEGEEEGGAISELGPVMSLAEVLDVVENGVVEVDVAEGPGPPLSRGRLALTETHSRPEQVVDKEDDEIEEEDTT